MVGTQRKDMICVEDVVRAICVLLNVFMSCPADISLELGEMPTIWEMIEYLYEITGSSYKLMFETVPMRRMK